MSNMEVDAQKEHIKDFLKGLTRAEKVIIALHYYDEMSLKEIAVALDLSEARVWQMHSSIVKRLKAYMKERNI